MDPMTSLNFTHYRFSMEKYSKCALECESRKQLVCGVKSAIGGHQGMYKLRRIIHRDISPGNIVFGTADPEPGWEGMIIDPELGTYTNGHPEANKDHAIATYRIGTQSYMSMLVFCAYEKPGVEKPSIPKILEAVYFSENMKTLDAIISPSWGHLREKGGLVDKFHDYISDLAFEKEHYVRGGVRDARKLEVFVTKSDEHYARILEIFQEAIEGFEKAGEEEEEDAPCGGPLTPSRAANVQRPLGMVKGF
ncbi:other/FunK1 protein kinase [Coprinopsis cinerea AmutBmut pab1-1]|nr:other/FunK1 protein kinase [Coprinopsis cinerea AmutBmut pab1-1]